MNFILPQLTAMGHTQT